MADLTELLAVSALILKLERHASSGLLGIEEEMDTRVLIVRACKAFKLSQVAERPVSNVTDIFEATETLVRKEMERSYV